MNSELEKNFSTLIKDPTRFNQEYGAKSQNISEVHLLNDFLLEIETDQWRFQHVHFDHISMARCKFHQTTFENCRFEFADIKNCEFTNCTFRKCVFISVAIDSNQFNGGSMAQNQVDAERGFRPEFNQNVFTGIQFQENNFSETSLEKSKFLQCQFKGNDFSEASMNDCAFDQPILQGNNWKNASLIDATYDKPLHPEELFLTHARFLTATFNNAQLAFTTIPDTAGNGLTGAALDGAILFRSHVDLKSFVGSFGVGGGSNCVYENLNAKKENFVLGSFKDPLKDNVYRNIQCKIFDLGLTKGENCLFENIDAELLDLEAANLKNCTFRNVRVRQMIDFSRGTFENVKWENITTDPKCEIRLDGSTYREKPF